MASTVYYVLGFIVALITTIITVTIINKKQLKSFEEDINTNEENIDEKE